MFLAPLLDEILKIPSSEDDEVVVCLQHLLKKREVVLIGVVVLGRSSASLDII